MLGWNPAETTLTPTAVRTGSFGLLQTPVQLDEQIDGQPLIVRLTALCKHMLAGIHCSSRTPSLHCWTGRICGRNAQAAPLERECPVTTELKYLAYTAMLTAHVGQLPGPHPRPVPLWGKRADRVYLNALEAFAPLAALVTVAQLTGKANALTAFWAMSFFWLRLTHAIVSLFGVPYIERLSLRWAT